MKRPSLFLTMSTLLFFFLYNLPALEAQMDPRSKEFQVAVDSLFADKTDMAGPGASIIILKGNERILSKNYGSANLTFGVPFSENTVFPLSGFSEQLVVFSLLQLEQNGQINLKDPVNKYLSEFGFQDQVTLAHLLNHTSDLQMIGSLRLMAGWNFTDPFYQQDFVNVTKAITKDLKPDIAIHHSHAGIKILQMVIEKVTKMPYSKFATTTIFRPLGMTETVIKNETYQANKNNSIGYHSTDDGFQKTVDTEYAGMCPTTYTTQGNFEKWMINIQSKKLAAQVIEQMDQPLTVNGTLQERANRSYCIGQQRYYKYLGQDEFYAMDTGGGHSWKWIRIADYSVLAVGNEDTYIGNKVNEIARLLFPQPAEATEPATTKSTPINFTTKELETYTGFYWDDDYLFTTQISIKDGALFYEDLDNGWNFALAPLSKSMFEAPPWNKVEFKDLDGEKKLTLILQDGRELPAKGYDPSVILPKDYPTYAGTYTSDKLKSFFKLIVADNKLIMKRSRKPDLELSPIGKNKFRTPEIDFRLIEFQMDNQGAIDQMRISNSGLKNVEFRKL